MVLTAILLPVLALTAAICLKAFHAKRAEDVPLKEASGDPHACFADRIRALSLTVPMQGKTRVRQADSALRLLRRALREPSPSTGLAAATDNGRYLLTALAALEADLRACPPLPATGRGEARMMLLSRELLRVAPVTPEVMLSALDAWQERGVTTRDERMALPLCMRTALADALSDTLRSLLQDAAHEKRGRRLARRAASVRRPMRLLTASRLTLSETDALLQALRDAGQETLLVAMDELLREAGQTGADIADLYARRQALYAERIGRILASFRALDRLDWPRLLADHDPLNRLMREEPSGVYPRMTPDSQGDYLARARDLARLFSVDEERLVRGILTLCRTAERDDARYHVGWYLMKPEGAQALHVYLHARSGAGRLFLRRHAFGVYRSGLWVLAALFACGLLPLGVSPWLLPLTLPVLGCVSRRLMTALMCRALPALPLPQLRVERVTEELRTLVIIPALLRDRRDALPLVRRLLTVRRAFPEGEIDCLLLADYGDSLTRQTSEDRPINEAVQAAISAIDRPDSRFLYLHRSRFYDKKQHGYIGRERKRGAVESICRLIVEGQCDDEFDASSVPPDFFYRRYAYVLTLDSDVIPAPDVLHAMLGILSHPLNRREQTAEGVRGVSILQPRMAVAPASVATPIALLEGGEGGVEPYGGGSPQLWQHLCGQGRFEGKGLIRPDAMLSATQGMILPDTVLSHDLLEGELAGCAQAADCPMYERHPATVEGWLRRLHRWTRGDWQLLPWLLPRVRTENGILRNPLSALSRFKIRENLRRSLIPLCQAALLLLSAVLKSGGLFCLALVPQLLDALFPPRRLSPIRAAFRLTLLPLRAAVRTDAAARALWRAFISRERLLDWTVSAHDDRGGVSPLSWWAQETTAALLVALSVAPLPVFWPGVALAVAFALGPLLQTRLDAPLHTQPELDESSRESLSGIAAATWRFFEETVTAAEHALPPDNLQLKPYRGPARRTSPTNIGLYLLSCLAARELDLIDTQELARRVSLTMDTLSRLPLWNGLPYNWYATDTLAVLPPAYVSTVDCGNLCACLMALAQGLRAWLPEIPESGSDLPARVDEFAAGMRLSLLYDPQADLFRIGMNVQTGEMDAGHYDLYASEALLTSFVAVLRRDVPLRHLARLSRVKARVGHDAPLVSWSGTMFEYLLPTLLLPVVPGTETACTLAAVIRAQKRRGVDGMFGISESGWWGFDEHMNYQYHAYGLPELAMDGAAAYHPIIAPYAAALCLPFDPSGAAESLSRLQSHGMLGRLGFFEAFDLEAAHLPEDTGAAIVQSHMAHHQGMLLCAVCNALTSGALWRHFLSIPVVETFSLLLMERHQGGAALPPRLPRPSQPPHWEMPFQRPAVPQTAPLDAHLIGNREISVLVSAAGFGGIRSRGLDLTRFTADPTRCEGPQFYLRLGGSTLRACDVTDDGEASFGEGSVRFLKQLDALESDLRVMIDPVRGAVLHQWTLTNRSDAPLALDAADCLVPALEQAASRHPAYSDLFMETGRPEPWVLTATRRPRSEGEAPVILCHSLTVSAEDVRLAVETDRMAFEGRNRSLLSPAALEAPLRDGLVGAPITPCLSFRVQMKLGPRGRATLCFLTRLLRPDELSLPESLAPRLTDASSALMLSQLMHRTLARESGLTGDRLRALSQLIGAVMWRHQPHQGASAPLTSPASALAEVGVRVELPLLTVEVHSGDGVPLLGDAADFAGWLTLLGRPVCLCCLCVGDQAEHARELCERLLTGKPIASDRDGCARVLTADQLPGGLRDTLSAVSRLTLYEGAGSAEEQLLALRAPLPEADHRFVPADAPELPEESLQFDCGFGGFQPQSGDYVIRLRPGENTPAPWCNVLTDTRFGTLTMESGLNMSFTGNSQQGRVTPWSNDPVCPVPGEMALVTDTATGALFSPTLLPCGQDMALRVQHGTGVSVYQALGHGLNLTLNCAAIPGHSAGLRALRLKNQLRDERRLTVTLITRFVLGEDASDEAQVCLTRVKNGVVAVSPAIASLGYLCLPEEQCLSRRMSPLSLFGEGGLRLAGLDENRDEPGSVAVLSVPVVIPPGGSASVVWLLGAARAADDMERALNYVRESGASAVFRAVRQRWAARLNALQVETPDPAFNLLVNRILPYQVRASRLSARCGFYQAGGAIGFRDQLQDMTALTLTEPEHVRAHLLLCARHQFPEGDVQHWWHPPMTGVRTRIADDRLFLPFMTAWYIARTGDTGVLSESVPWLSGEKVPPDQEASYGTPAVTVERDPLYEHCMRALTSVRLGPHGLPLMGGGDWNDGMNHVRGESVWLALFYAQTLELFSAYAAEGDRADMLAVRSRLLASVEQSAWDGSWYLRAWFEDGAPLGSASGEECRIDSLSQSWAVFALGVTDRTAQALEEAWQRLYIPRDGMMLLLTPPFNGLTAPGYISGYLPGIRENGGQYTHAAVWMLMALLRMGWRDRAFALLDGLNPIHHASAPESAARYRLEPYALAGDVYANPQQWGRGGWSQYTGAAAWLYTACVERVLGLEKQGDRVRLRPTVPDAWEDFTLVLRHGSASYRLYARKGAAPACDHRPLPDGWLTLTDDGGAHEAVWPL